MPVYAALLRGVNLGPHKRMKMVRLRESFESLGLEQVQTYIQSGNVIFKTRGSVANDLCREIEERIFKDFGFEAPVILRKHEELRRVAGSNPFATQRGIVTSKLHVIFLADAPSPAALEALKQLTRMPDESRCIGREIYLHLPNGMGQSSLANNPVKRRWLKRSTTRNWKTVNQLHEMCQACG